MRYSQPVRILSIFLVLFAAACGTAPTHSGRLGDSLFETSGESPPLEEIASDGVRTMLASAYEQTRTTTEYTQEYFRIPYPNGDVPANTGACTDVVIRSLRNAGIDLQKEVHEDMKKNFAAYPAKWGLRKPDTNIDHRRVPNLQAFFKRRGLSLPVSQNPENYRPGDIVSWDLDGKGMTHIGIISNRKDRSSGRYMIIHNIGSGARLEDRLFDWEITGHFRYFN